MDLLKALVDQYDHLKSIYPDEIPDVGYTSEKINYLVFIDLNGNLKDIHKLDKDVPNRLVVEGTQRNGDIQPRLFWDNCSYLFGLKLKKYPHFEEYESSKVMYKELLNDKHPVLLFYENHDLKNGYTFKEHDAVKKFLIDDKEKKDFEKGLFQLCSYESMTPFSDTEIEKKYLEWRFARENLKKGTCLVTGEEDVLICKIFSKLKGIGQSSGSSLVSFKAPSTRSYSAKSTVGCEHLSISVTSMSKATIALNFMMRKTIPVRYEIKDKNGKTKEKTVNCYLYNVSYGDEKIIFWSKDEEALRLVDNSLGTLLSEFGQDESRGIENVVQEQLSQTMSTFANGGRFRKMKYKEIESFLNKKHNKIYFLTLKGNAGRTAVSRFEVNTIEKFAENYKAFNRSFGIIDEQGINVKDILRCIHRDGAGNATAKDDINNNATIRSIVMRSLMQGKSLGGSLTGKMLTVISNSYPYLQSIKDKELGRALTIEKRQCQVLHSTIYDEALSEKGGINMLNKEEKDVGYLLGRYFALVEKTNQDYIKAYNGENVSKKTVADYYFTKITTHPLFVYDKLDAKFNYCNRELRKKNPNSYIWREKEASEIIDKLDITNLHGRLSLKSQAMLRIGYKHEMNYLFTKNEEKVEVSENE